MKPFFRLDDASEKFWLKVRQIFLSLGLRTMIGDEAFYYLHLEDNDFMEMILVGVSNQITVSKIERDKFDILVWMLKQ